MRDGCFRPYWYPHNAVLSPVRDGNTRWSMESNGVERAAYTLLGVYKSVLIGIRKPIVYCEMAAKNVGPTGCLLPSPTSSCRKEKLESVQQNNSVPFSVDEEITKERVN